MIRIHSIVRHTSPADSVSTFALLLRRTSLRTLGSPVSPLPPAPRERCAFSHSALPTQPPVLLATQRTRTTRGACARVACATFAWHEIERSRAACDPHAPARARVRQENGAQHSPRTRLLPRPLVLLRVLQFLRSGLAQRAAVRREPAQHLKRPLTPHILSIHRFPMASSNISNVQQTNVVALTVPLNSVPPSNAAIVVHQTNAVALAIPPLVLTFVPSNPPTTTSNLFQTPPRALKKEGPRTPPPAPRRIRW